MTITQMLWRAIPGVAASFLLADPCRAQALLNVNFGADAAKPKVGLAATGIGPRDVWNATHRPFVSNYDVTDLVWSDGSPSPVTINVDNAPGAWANQTADPMFSAYIYPHGGIITLTIRNVPRGEYDFYLYGHGGPATDEQNSVFTAESSGRTYGPLATTTGPGWSSPEWKEGDQYVVLRGVFVEDGLVLVKVSPGASQYALLAGMQMENTCALAAKKGARRVEARLGDTVNLTTEPIASVFPISYQWQFGSADIPGATSSNLMFQAESASQAGFYTAILSNANCVAEHRFYLDFNFVSVKHVPSFALDAPVGTTWDIQSAQNLGGPWATFTNVVAPARPHVFFDPAITNSIHRFYRAIEANGP